MSNIKKLQILFLLVLLSVLFISSYDIVRLNNVSSTIVSLVTFIIILIGPLSIYLLLIRPRLLPKIVAYLSFILCLAAAYFIIPTHQRDLLNRMLIWLLPVVEISIICIVLYSITKSFLRYKEVHSKGSHSFLEVMRMSLEPKLGKGVILEIVLTELSVFYYSILVWFNKPTIEVNETYSYHQTSQTKTIVIVFSSLILVEGVLFHFLIQLWNEIAAWIFTVLNIYAFLYMVGLYNSVKLLPHFIQEEKLMIRLGYQSRIELDINNIDQIKHAEQGGIDTKVPKDTYYSLLNIDSPQYELFLKDPVLMVGFYGRKKYVKTVVFRVDQPNELITRINSIRNQSDQSFF